MAEHTFALALNTADTPAISRLRPRSVIVSGIDNNLRNPASSNTNNYDNNPANLPQTLYVENVMPLPEGGVKSVGYTKLQNAGATSTFDEVYIIRDEDENEWYFSPAEGYNYVVQTLAVGAPWVSTNPLGSAPTSQDFSIAYVNGMTYICYAHTYIGHWDSGTTSFVSDSGSLAGVAIADIRTITGSGNYMIILCTDNTVRWSSLTNPLDFVPSEITGAGSQIPLDIRGTPLKLSPQSGGFLIHCRHNIVAGIYTNNSAQPWIFREVKNSGGYIARYEFTRESSSNNIYAFTTYGLQTIDLRTAENVFPEANDFLSGRVYETFDTATKLLTLNEDTAGFNVRVTWILGRFVFLSYGRNADNYYIGALVYDVLLRRWGDIKFNHVDIFAVRNNSVNNNVGILTRSGEIHRLDLNYLSSNAGDGVIILGRYQLDRKSQICSQELALELLHDATDITVSVATSYNGSTVGAVEPMVEYDQQDQYTLWQKQIEGMNISFIIEGDFAIASGLATVTKGASAT